MRDVQIKAKLKIEWKINSIEWKINWQKIKQKYSPSIRNANILLAINVKSEGVKINIPNIEPKAAIFQTFHITDEERESKILLKFVIKGWGYLNWFIETERKLHSKVTTMTNQINNKQMGNWSRFFNAAKSLRQKLFVRFCLYLILSFDLPNF